MESTWVEIDTGALIHNFRALATNVGVPVCAVVKSNGYGHGTAIAARAFLRAGAAMVAVTRIEEARELRDAGIGARVLILAPVPDPLEAVKLDCDITLGSATDVNALPSDARVHLAVDTGMGRLGIAPDEVFPIAAAIKERAQLESIWTHFAAAASATGPVQLQRFRAIVSALRNGGVVVSAHASNSAAVLALPAARFDMVRVGTLLYGQNPLGARASWDLRDPFAWYARVAAVRTLPPGAAVGYGSEWRSRKPVRVATIPVGWADGFMAEPDARSRSAGETAKSLVRVAARALRRSRAVYFGDKRAPVVGRIGMQLTTVLVDDLPEVGVGSIARVPARRPMVDASIPRIERERS